MIVALRILPYRANGIDNESHATDLYSLIKQSHQPILFNRAVI